MMHGEKVLDMARQAAAAMLRAYPPNDAEDQAVRLALAINVESGLCDDTVRVQAFAAAILAAYNQGLADAAGVADQAEAAIADVQATVELTGNDAREQDVARSMAMYLAAAIRALGAAGEKDRG